jgi:hypothetical protein
MQTYTGRAFYPMTPRAEDVDIRDIAHALSLICRYGGHTRRFYSVAEHCWLMSYAVPLEHALKALLHDATEAYVGDMVRPLKHQLPAYMEAEDRVWTEITARFGITQDMPACVKQADNRILLDERAALLTPPPHAWVADEQQATPLGVRVNAWAPDVAELWYLQRFHELTNGAFA